MKASNKLSETRNAEMSETAIDPFAADFFGVRTELVEEISPPKKIVKRKKELSKAKQKEWFAKLPKVTNQEARFSERLENFPQNLTEESAKIISRTIAEYTFRHPDTVECEIISASETNFKEAIKRISKSPQIFLTIGCQPNISTALIAVNTVFASTLIDLILGGQGTEIADRRELSAIEITIIEFLAGNILGEINRYFDEPIFCLQAVESHREIPVDSDERNGEFVFMIEAGDFSGILTVFAPKEFLDGLDRLQNPLLMKNAKRKSIAATEKIIPKVALNLQVGKTTLDAESLLFLETDDIVLIEEPKISLENFMGEIQEIFVGSSKSFRFSGIAESDFSGELSVEIKEIISEEWRRKFTNMNLKTDEKENDLTENLNDESNEQNAESEIEESKSDEEISASLENIQVGLRVEMSGNKISLRELQNLRVGQIISLGCKPTDVVRLMSDSNEEPLATGELVEIEGQLGVRLKKVFI